MTKKKKLEGEQGAKTLSLKKENGWEKYGKEHVDDVFSFCEDYKSFLDSAKTEREAVHYVTKHLDEKGYVNVDTSDVKKGSKKSKVSGYYRILHKKSVVVFRAGKKDMESGVNIIGAHVDAPRIDLKPNPLYEDAQMAYFKTHYYGGIKKYQWTAIPLAIHGVFVKENGDVLKVKLGEDEQDPVFTITDLLPHLAQDQMQKKLAEGISGEDLNLLVGSMPYVSAEGEKEIKDKFKYSVLHRLYATYGITEEDFVSSEIEIVPAFKARDVGFDKSMVGAYGQDDRICAFMALRAFLDAEQHEHGTVLYLSDKEEIGSVGNTGAQSTAFENFMLEMAYVTNSQDPLRTLKQCLQNSRMLSADVSAAYDPNFGSAFEKNNASYLGRGVVLNKYTGARGKSGASDANAEFVALVRNIFKKHDVQWQAAELGKVDLGGGGTIALFFANLGIQVLDCGVAILSMHAPFEIAGKMDIYTCYRGYKAFYEY